MPEAPKRILIVTTELGMGGAERCVANIACRLNPAKYQLHVVSLAPRPEPPKDALVCQLDDAQVPLTFLDCRSKWQLLAAVNRLKRVIQKTSPDVLWSFLFHANMVAAMAARATKARRLQSLRVVEQGSWRRRFQSWAAQQADRVLCVSQGVRQFAAGTLRVPEEKLVVIPNGIDVDAIQPTSYTEPTGRKHRLIAVGRLDPQKDYETMLLAASYTMDKHQDWELAILGDGPEREAIEFQVVFHGASEWTQLVGWQSDVSAWLREAEIFLLTSRWEGMPNALIEAMAHGLPVVTTNIEGTTELLPGKLADQIASTEQFVQGKTILGELMDDPQLRQQLGQANRQQIETHFSLRQMVQSYEAMLDDLLSTPPQQR
ncbi:glycosyltransferase [Bremerella sp. JC770]|uniref:glycosyltransferase n=1 Tax=Bremerella sp. JC770 TaxID=3232137 RepID=UPI003457F69F